VFHPDVRVWQVRDEAGTHVGLFYGDSFARPGKRSGAWCASYRDHETFTGEVLAPITSNNNNFVRGAAGDAVQLSLDDARTLFHEFGTRPRPLSEVNYRARHAAAGLRRVPSQSTMWLLTRPVLDGFARHRITGEPMQPLVERTIARRPSASYAVTEYFRAIIDSCHGGRQGRRRRRLRARVAGAHRRPRQVVPPPAPVRTHRHRPTAGYYSLSGRR
jgi:peptidyl-dipeptidase Dcp